MATGSLFRKLVARALGLLIICISASFPALAQDNAPNAPNPPNAVPSAPSASPTNPGVQEPSPVKQAPANPDKMKERQLKRLQEIAQLTPDQKTKVTPIINNFVDQVVAVRNDTSLQPEEKKAKQKELRKEYNRQLHSLLTPEQKQALRNARVQKQGKGQNRNQDGTQEEDQRFEQESNQPGADI